MTERLAPYARNQLANLDRLVAVMIAEVALSIPMVADLSAELQQEMSDWLGRMMSSALELVAADKSLVGLGPTIEQMARRRSAQGLECWETLRIYEVAQQALLEDLSAQLQGHPHEQELYPQLTRRLLEFQRVISTWVTAGYSAEPESCGPDRESQVQSLLEMRAGRRLTDLADHDLGRRLGLALPLREVTVSIELGAELADTVRSVARANPWGIVGALDGRLVALTLRTPHGFTVPGGRAELIESAGPAEVHTAVLAAGRAADVAVMLGVPRLADTDTAPLAAMLALPEASREAYVRGCFGSLPQTSRGRALLIAVSATLTHARIADAARALHIHRHTLDYRLSRFTEVTGQDLNDPPARFRCGIALFLVGLMPLRADQVPPPAPPRPPDGDELRPRPGGLEEVMWQDRQANAEEVR